MNAERQNKHKEKHNLNKQILGTSSQLKRCLTSIIYIALLHQINKAIKSKIKAVSARHLKKLKNLRLRQNNVSPRKNNLVYLKHTICNMSSYHLTHEEERALSHSLDHHIPSKTDPNLIYTEFETYCQSIRRKVTNLPGIQTLHLKTKLRNACEQYNNINVPYKKREIINKLKKNQNIMLLRQDKGRGIVTIDRNRYTNKYLNILNTEQFRKLGRDPTKPTEAKIQRALRKIKNHLSNQEYMRNYPTGSAPRKFYGTAKKHKIQGNGTINYLPLRPVISNVGTASFQLTKYLVKLLSPLRTYEYTVANNTEFINHVKRMNIPKDHSFISFDVKSLSTYVPLDFTINVTLKRIYNENEIHTNIKRSEMKELLLLCTKNVHFTFNNDIYQQCDGVAMGFLSGPVIAGIFLLELERTLLLKLTEYTTPWKQYVDDTIATIKSTLIDHILMILNTFHKNIKFTYELEINKKNSFLNVFLIRKNDTLDTMTYVKCTNNAVYLHWDSFAPKNWKRSTLRSILTRAYKICSTKELLDEELKCIKR